MQRQNTACSPLFSHEEFHEVSAHSRMNSACDFVTLSSNPSEPSSRSRQPPLPQNKEVMCSLSTSSLVSSLAWLGLTPRNSLPWLRFFRDYTSANATVQCIVGERPSLPLRYRGFTSVCPSVNRHRLSAQAIESIWVRLPKSHPTKVSSRRNKK